MTDGRRTIIITGAADGIGRATAERLAAADWNVLAADIDGEKLSWTERTAGVEAFAADVTAEAHNLALVDAALEIFGRVDAAFFNAGISLTGAVDRMPVAEWRRVVEVNLFGPLLGVRAVLPALREAGGGSIVITSSLMGLGGDTDNSAYAASKHGVIGLVRSLARELGGEAIRVNALCPGLTESGMTAQLRDHAPNRYLDLAQQTPPNRWAVADEMASVVEFLVSPGAKYVSGHAMVVDAGTIVGTGLMQPSVRTGAY